MFIEYFQVLIAFLIARVNNSFEKNGNFYIDSDLIMSYA